MATVSQFRGRPWHYLLFRSSITVVNVVDVFHKQFLR